MKTFEINKIIFANIFPMKYFYTLIFFLFLSFVSPLVVLVSIPAFEFFSSHPIIFLSLGIFFTFFSTVSVFLFVQLKNPFMQEWKEKLGYEESSR